MGVLHDHLQRPENSIQSVLGAASYKELFGTYSTTGWVKKVVKAATDDTVIEIFAVMNSKERLHGILCFRVREPGYPIITKTSGFNDDQFSISADDSVNRYVIGLNQRYSAIKYRVIYGSITVEDYTE